MSKRSVRKIRHYAPAPTFKERVLAGKDERDGGQGVRLMDFWRRSVSRYQKPIISSLMEEGVIELDESSNEDE
jgi:hypothetical protein